MKKRTHAGVLMTMMFLAGNIQGQEAGLNSAAGRNQRVTETSLQPVLNMVSTNLHYGKSNAMLSNYRKSSFGPQVGLSFQAGITSRFSIVSQLYFVMKGGKLDSNNPLTGDKSSLRLYTLETPLLARFHFGSFYVDAGPAIAYNLCGTRKMSSTTTSVSFSKTGNSSFKRLDTGLQLGAGYMFRIKQKKLALDIRYTHGLRNISNDSEIFNRYLNVSLYIFKPWKTNPFAWKRN